MFILRFKLRLDRELRRSFECGFSSMEESRIPFSLCFFIVALVFLVFDVELLFLFPYIKIVQFNFRLIRILVIIIFLFTLSLGLFYE